MERFSIVSKVISELLWFMITSLSDWYKVLAPFFQPIRSEIKANRGSRVHIFPRFVSAKCNYFEFWFMITSLSDWFKVLAPFFQPIRSETKANRGSRVHIFPRFVSATCNYFEF